MPGLAQRVTPDKVSIPQGMPHLFAINYMCGIVSAMVIYLVFNWIWPQKRTLIPYVVYGTPISGVEVDEEGNADGDTAQTDQAGAAKSKEAEVQASAVCPPFMEQCI